MSNRRDSVTASYAIIVAHIQGSAEDKVAIADANEKAEEVVEEDGGGKPLTKKEKTALKRAAEKAVEAVIAAEEERMPAEVSLRFTPSTSPFSPQPSPRSQATVYKGQCKMDAAMSVRGP